jgi:hypothetical protein
VRKRTITPSACSAKRKTQIAGTNYRTATLARHNSIGGSRMQQKAVADVRRRLHTIPWDTPIRVQFFCDEAPLFGCRLCILRYGLRTGDRSYLFDSEDEAILHTCFHADIKAN